MPVVCVKRVSHNCQGRQTSGQTSGWKMRVPSDEVICGNIQGQQVFTGMWEHVDELYKTWVPKHRAAGSIGHQIKCKTTHCQSSGSRPCHHCPMLQQTVNSTVLAGILLPDPQILSLRSSTKIMLPEESYRPYVHVTGSGVVPCRGCRAGLMQYGSSEAASEADHQVSTSFSIVVKS